MYKVQGSILAIAKKKFQSIFKYLINGVFGRWDPSLKIEFMYVVYSCTQPEDNFIQSFS